MSPESAVGVAVVRWLLDRTVMVAISGLAVVDGAFGRWDPVVSGFAAMVGCSWLMREPWWWLDVVLSIWGGLWNE
jgi:hypothetical protein